jgi:hypothetical protein
MTSCSLVKIYPTIVYVAYGEDKYVWLIKSHLAHRNEADVNTWLMDTKLGKYIKLMT